MKNRLQDTLYARQAYELIAVFQSVAGGYGACVLTDLMGSLCPPGVNVRQTTYPEKTTVRHPQSILAGGDAFLKLPGKVLTFELDG